MKKISRIISLVCVLCVMVNILILPSGTASAAISESRIVHIYNMWNSNCMINDGGIAKYSASDSDISSVWTIAPYDSFSYTIRNWNGTYLYASENSAVCRELGWINDSYLWKLVSAGGGRYWIESVAQPGKALNIENLTGSIQLTNYYDTWESAKWIIDDTAAPELQIESDNVILQSEDQQKFLFGGMAIGQMNEGQASIITENYFYKIIDKGDYCYIQYSPSYGTPQYLYASPTCYSVSSILDEESPDYRWNIQKNGDGTSTIISVAYPEKCIGNNYGSELLDVAAAGDSGKWYIRSGNSLMITIRNSMNTYILAVDENNTEKAIFRYNDGDTDDDLSSQWQVIFSNGKMYLKNGLTGKYLRSSGVDGDVQAYVTDYNAYEDDLFVWDAVNLKYTLGLRNSNKYLCPDYQEYDSTDNVNAFIYLPDNYTSINLRYWNSGFAE